MHPGYTDSAGRVYYRCPNCGDSDNPNKAHCFVDVQGNSYCYKCNTVSTLDMTQYLYVMLNVAGLEEVIASDWQPFELEPLLGLENRRPTLLTRYVIPDNDKADAFAMRNARGRLVGYHSRLPGKVMLNEGDRGIDWVGSKDELLTSNSNDPIYIVEGPFDVVKPRYVSAMGSLSLSVFRHVKAQTCWAWPDPDIINTPAKRKSFVEMLNVANDNLCWIEGLIVSDADPDKCTTKFKVSLKDANAHVRNENANLVGRGYVSVGRSTNGRGRRQYDYSELFASS